MWVLKVKWSFSRKILCRLTNNQKLPAKLQMVSGPTFSCISDNKIKHNILKEMESRNSISPFSSISGGSADKSRWCKLSVIVHVITRCLLARSKHTLSVFPSEPCCVVFFLILQILSNRKGLLPEPNLAQLLTSITNPAALQILTRPYHTGKRGGTQQSRSLTLKLALS